MHATGVVDWCRGVVVVVSWSWCRGRGVVVVVLCRSRQQIVVCCVVAVASFELGTTLATKSAATLQRSSFWAAQAQVFFSWAYSSRFNIPVPVTKCGWPPSEFGIWNSEFSIFAAEKQNLPDFGLRTLDGKTPKPPTVPQFQVSKLQS